MKKKVVCIGIEMQKYVKIYHTSKGPARNSLDKSDLLTML